MLIESIRTVNAKVTKDNVSTVRVSMIRTGLIPDTDGVWRVTQLKPELQELISHYQSEFDKPNSMDEFVEDAFLKSSDGRLISVTSLLAGSKADTETVITAVKTVRTAQVRAENHLSLIVNF